MTHSRYPFRDAGKKLKQLRESRKESQETVAARAGLTRTTLAKYEAGEGTKSDELAKLYSAFGVTEDVFNFHLNEALDRALLGIAASPEAEQAAMRMARETPDPFPDRAEGQLLSFARSFAPSDAERLRFLEEAFKAGVAYAFRAGWQLGTRSKT